MQGSSEFDCGAMVMWLDHIENKFTSKIFITCNYTSCSIGGGIIALASSLPEVAVAAEAGTPTGSATIETAGKVVVNMATPSRSAEAAAETGTESVSELGIVHSALHILNETTAMDYNMFAWCRNSFS